MSIFVAPRQAPAKAGPIGPGAGVLLTEYPLVSLLGKDPHARMRTAYQIGMSVPWVRKAEAVIGSKVSTIDFDLDDPDGNEVDEAHPSQDAKACYDLLCFPQRNLDAGQKLSRSALWRITSRHIGLAGNAFWLLDRPEAYAGTPLSIAYIRPDRMTPKEDANGNLREWRIDEKPGSPGVAVSLEQVVHFMLEPPDTGHFGPGLVETALLRSQNSLNLDRHLASVISAGGRLSGFLSPKEGIIPDEQRLQLERDWRTITEQPDAAKRLQLVSAPIEFTPTTMTPDDLAIAELMRLLRDDLMAFWGVPGALLGIPQPQGLGGAEGRKFDEASLWQGPVHDRLVILGDGITEGILTPFEKLIGWMPKLRWEEPEFDDHTPLFENAERAKSLPLTNKERRDLIGYDPFDDERDDEVWLPATQVQAYMATPEPVVTVTTPQPKMIEAPPERAMDMAGETMEGKAVIRTGPLRQSLAALRDQMTTHHTPRIRQAVGRVLEEQQRDVAARLRGRADHVAANPRDTSVWWDAKRWNDALRSALLGAVTGMATAVSRQVSEALPGKAGPLSAVDRVMDRGAARVTLINERTRDAIVAWLIAGIDEGKTVQQVADDLERAVMDNGQPIFDEYRSELIARTELMDAYNASALYSYSDAGIEMVQAIDGDQDEECAARNGQEFTVDEAAAIEDHPNGTLDWVPVLVTKADPIESLVRELRTERSESRTARTELGNAFGVMKALAEPVAPPTVNVDLTPVAQALDRFAETFRSLPAPIVNVPAPIVNIPARATVRRVIRDKDGNITEVREE